MSVKDLISEIKRNGLLVSMHQLEELYNLAIEKEEKLTESEARCAALAAENAGLKAAKEIIRHLNVNREEANFCGIDDCYIDDAVAAMITPATDAFLAEVRAEHLQSYADSIAARMKDKSLSMRQKERLNFAWAEAKSYAAELHNAQLRKGAQS